MSDGVINDRIDALIILNNRIDISRSGPITGKAIPRVRLQKRIIVADAGSCGRIIVDSRPAIIQLVDIIKIKTFDNTRLSTFLGESQSCGTTHG